MKIVVADAQPKVRYALRVLLEQQPGLRVVAEAADVEDLIAVAPALAPALLLLDWNLPGKKNTQLIAASRLLFPGVMIIVMSEKPDAQIAALAAGADAFASKADSPEKLLVLINQFLTRPLSMKVDKKMEVENHQ